MTAPFVIRLDAPHRVQSQSARTTSIIHTTRAQSHATASRRSSRRDHSGEPTEDGSGAPFGPALRGASMPLTMRP